MGEGLHKIVSSDETIVAVSTPLGRSAIGQVRISGGRAVAIAEKLLKRKSALKHRVACFGAWTNTTGEVLDEVVVTLFQGPNSYTGEDVLEITSHGNPLILTRIVESVRAEGARLAAPGEFTLRAVTHGKMDLIQAEAVRQFIDAQTEGQARTALRQMEGSLSKRIGPIKEALVDLIAHLEAGMDFGEDGVDVPANEFIAAKILPLESSLVAIQQTFAFGTMLAEGLRVSILGKPNVGKSSLFNGLVVADRAIVTEIPGTTRDVLTETIHLNGVPLRFADTAGIHETTDCVESIGVARTLEVLSTTDLALVVLDGSRQLDCDDANVMARARSVKHLIVVNKTDLPQVVPLVGLNGLRTLQVSAKTGQGMQELRDAIHGFVAAHKTDLADDLVLTNARQNEAINRAVESLSAGMKALGENIPQEMVLLDLYSALSALGELTGEVVTDDILDRIFSTFCIGK